MCWTEIWMTGITQTDTDVNYSRAGSYTMSVEEVSNSFGDTSTADLPVHVVSADNQQVQIGLTTGIVYASAGEQLSIPQIMSRV